MPLYRYLEHRSDLLIEGKGHSLPRAIESIAQGLFNAISSKNASPANSSEVKFSESGVDMQDLIINIFTRVLAEMDSHSKIGISLKVLKLDAENNTADVLLTLADGPARLHVKAVTFHDFSLSKTEDGLTLVRVLFDI